MSKLNVSLFGIVFVLLIIVFSGAEIRIEIGREVPVAPEQIVARAFEYFNQENNELMNEISDNPFVVVMGEAATVFDGYGDAINFDGIKRNGWVYTKINEISIVYDDNESAMVTVDFSRMNESDVAYSTTVGTYLLVNNNNSWKLKGAFFPVTLPLGE
ncbi:MAG: hypothetical protein P8N40_10870 [Gammaproteobacteria bacterium]|nr:hypothetical protein [Gammaproteobacteria bacterium]